MKKVMSIILFLSSLLTGCKEGQKTTDASNLQKQNQALQDQVKQLQSKLQVAEQKNQQLQGENESIKAAHQSVIGRFPKLSKFSMPQEFKQIQIKYSSGSKIITDPEILKSFSIIIKDSASLGSGPQADTISTYHGSRNNESKHRTKWSCGIRRSLSRSVL